MDILLKESYRMQNIINDILELSRLDQTRVKLDFKELDVKAVVKEVLIYLSQWLKENIFLLFIIIK